MEIGDKLIFDTYLPITTAGDFKDFFYEYNGRRRRSRPWVVTLDTNSNVISWEVNRIYIKKQEGIFIGTFKKKLKRDYDLRYRSDTRTVAEEEPILATDNIFRETVRGVPIRHRLDRTSSNPNRLDNPRELSTLAIIATSKRKRYVVDMEDIHRCNIRNTIKII